MELTREQRLALLVLATYSAKLLLQVVKDNSISEPYYSVLCEETV